MNRIAFVASNETAAPFGRSSNPAAALRRDITWGSRTPRDATQRWDSRQGLGGRAPGVGR